MDHLQDNCGQISANNFRVGKLRAALEVLLAVEAVTDALTDPATAAGTLVGTGLGDSLDRQSLDLAAETVAGYPGASGVDYIANAGYCQRGFGNIGAKHHPAATVGAKDFALLCQAKPGIERDYFRVR